MRHCGVTQRGTVSYGGHAGVVLQYTLLSLTYVSISDIRRRTTTCDTAVLLRGELSPMEDMQV